MANSKSARVRKTLCVFLTLLALFLAGTVIVLTTVVQYFGVDWRDVLTEPEMKQVERLAANAHSLAPLVNNNIHLPTAATVPSSLDDDDEDDASAVDALYGDTTEPDDAVDFVAELVRRAGINASSPSPSANDTKARQPRIPKIIHQTWKTDTLPEKWQSVRENCAEMHPDYEYMLWSDALSREFIATHYPWFLTAFDGYVYPIQRADAIRYFVLHHYGGIYMDIDIGCKRNMDPLLYFQVVLPATIPVGVSNDLMFAEKGHPFMDLVIHNLVTFNHQYGTNYPTVMFSTGPMFLSAQYGLWPKEDADGQDRQVRILPRRWYGKNAPITEAEDSYFEHYYASSWHADDAGFITFLGKFGRALMILGMLVVVLGLGRMLWSKRSLFKKSGGQRPLGPIALPYHVGADGLPFARPGTPGGSRPDSPFGGSRSSTPGGSRRPSDGGVAGGAARGVLYYLPVWFLPSESGQRSPGATSPSGGQSWASYLPNLAAYEEQGEHRYHPLPSFSRPPSPSNNSILHAPGSLHDGAFDGVPLHSIHSPKPTRPRASTPPPASHSSSTPTSPNPPAYSTLKSWSTSLFRNGPFTSPRSSLLPTTSSTAPSGSPPPPATPHDGFLPSHAKSSSTASNPGAPPPRSRSPLPPQYSSHSHSNSLSGAAAVLASSGAGAGAGGRGGMVRTGSGQGQSHQGGVLSSATTAATVAGASEPPSDSDFDDGLGDEYDTATSSKAGVEDEVDRLLNEMEPTMEAKLASLRRAGHDD